MTSFDLIEEQRELVTGLEYEDWRDRVTESEASDSSDEADGTDASELEEAA